MIRFVPEGDGTNEGVTDASYHLPAFYELWARWGPEEDRAFWAKAADVSRDFIVKTANPETGLNPNYANFDGSPRNAFEEDAWRCAMNWTVDHSWFNKESRQPEASDKLQKFLESQGMDKYGDHFELTGKVTRDRHSP